MSYYGPGIYHRNDRQFLYHYPLNVLSYIFGDECYKFMYRSDRKDGETANTIIDEILKGIKNEEDTIVFYAYWKEGKSTYKLEKERTDSMYTIRNRLARSESEIRKNKNKFYE